MAKFKLTVIPAHERNGVLTMLLSLMVGDKQPMPRRDIEARTTVEALAALDVYAREAERTGRSLRCSIDLLKGERAPSGFRQAKTHCYVNLCAEGEDKYAEQYRIAENTEVNKGFYVRPNDEFNFSPSGVYPTVAEAWKAWRAEGMTEKPASMEAYSDAVYLGLAARGITPELLAARGTPGADAVNIETTIAHCFMKGTAPLHVANALSSKLLAEPAPVN